MKKENFNKVEKFSSWLKKHVKVNGDLFKSDVAYCNYLMCAVADIGANPNQFFSINQPGVLKSIFKSLTKSGTFLSRDEKLRSDIICGYNKYIEFVASVN